MATAGAVMFFKYGRHYLKQGHKILEAVIATVHGSLCIYLEISLEVIQRLLVPYGYMKLPSSTTRR
jgi:hypothetical protein